jgi:hypothetical protein
MAVTLEQVRALIDRDEPDYVEAARLGPDALPHLRTLVTQGDPMLASKAAYLASLIPAAEAADVVELAARSPHDTVRVASAAGVRNLQSVPDTLISQLAADLDFGVRKTMLSSIQSNPRPELRTKLQEIAQNDPTSSLRTTAEAILRTMP